MVGRTFNRFIRVSYQFACSSASFSNQCGSGIVNCCEKNKKTSLCKYLSARLTDWKYIWLGSAECRRRRLTNNASFVDNIRFIFFVCCCFKLVVTRISLWPFGFDFLMWECSLFVWSGAWDHLVTTLNRTIDLDNTKTHVKWQHEYQSVCGLATTNPIMNAFCAQVELIGVSHGSVFFFCFVHFVSRTD